MERRNVNRSTSGEGGADNIHRVAQPQAGPEVTDISLVMLNAGVNFAKRNKKLTGTWLLGLFLLCFATGLAVAPEQEEKYSQIVSKIDHDKTLRAERQLYIAEEEYYRSKGWFSCDAYCMEKYNRMLEAESTYKKIKAVNEAQLSKAKAEVGVFSEYGVQEARDLFWGIFAKGKGFSQKSSWYDLIFMGIDSMGRDEQLLSFIIRWIFQLAMNFTIGMTGTLIAFVWYLWSMVTTYQPNVFVATAFFALATITATSLIVTFLVGLYFSAAGSAFVIVKAAGPNFRLGDGGRRRTRYIPAGGRYGRPMGGYGRPHQY